MKNLLFVSRKLLRHSLAVLLLFTLLSVSLSSITYAETPAAMPQIAPLNPDLIEHFQKRHVQTQDSGESYSSFTGYVPPTFDLSHLKNSPSIHTASGTLPTYLDWRDQNKVTPIKDQGQAGTCWVFGTLASLESRIGVVENQPYSDLYDFSEQNLVLAVDPSHVFQAADRANSGGDSFLSTDTLTKWGTVLESTQPYDISTLNTGLCNRELPPLQRISDFRIIASLGISEPYISSIKTAILNYGPVIAAFFADVGSLRPGKGNMYDGFVYDYPSFSDQDNYYFANHMVCIVGWDDSIRSPRTGNYGAWIVKNSWGTDWGNNGYFYLCYGAGNLQEVGSYHGSAGYKAYNSSERLYYWDEAGLVTGFGFGSSSAWMRSIFSAEKSGVLTSVNFWTTDNNVQYEIYIRNSNDTILGTQSGICSEMGYYTIPLNFPLRLFSGQEFKIDVKITDPSGYKYPIPIEKYSTITEDGQEFPYTDPPIQRGVCFFRSSDQDPWQDASLYSEDGTQIPFNVCLRATVLESDLANVPASNNLYTGLMAVALATLMIFSTLRRKTN